MSPVVAVSCHRCGGAARLSFDDRFIGGRLRNWESFQCPHCSTVYHADGNGRLPDSQRRIVLAGRALRVDPAVTPDRLTALRAMRTLFGGSPADARTRWEELVAGEPMTKGEAGELASLIPGIAFLEGKASEGGE